MEETMAKTPAKKQQSEEKLRALSGFSSSEYGNESISQLQGPDRVRLRPGVIFGSDGLDGCEHAVFEILSNSIDEAREGYGNLITVTYYSDCSIEVEDFGRGCPLDWNPREDRWNWELVFCELYAGGKYNNNAVGGDYGFALGLNGLGSCATQYASKYMDVTVRRDGRVGTWSRATRNPLLTGCSTAGRPRRWHRQST